MKTTVNSSTCSNSGKIMGQSARRARLFVAPSILAATPARRRAPHIPKYQSSKSQFQDPNSKQEFMKLPKIFCHWCILLHLLSNQQIDFHHFQNIIQFDYSNHPRDLIPIAIVHFSPILSTSLPRSGKLSAAPGDSFAAALVLLE